MKIAELEFSPEHRAMIARKFCNMKIVLITDSHFSLVSLDMSTCSTLSKSAKPLSGSVVMDEDVGSRQKNLLISEGVAGVGHNRLVLYR